jgi:ABC-type transport system involved in multi-copper enzyme maturation permease subunit
MFRLIRKDFIVGRNSLLINLAILFAMLILMFKIALPDFFLFMGIIYIVLLVISPITLEDKLNTWSLTASLPTNRSRIVIARYIYASIIILAMVAVLFLYGFLLDSLMTSRYINFSENFSYGQFISVFFIAVILSAIFVPFTYKFGQMGIVYGLGVSVLLSTVIFLILGLGLRDNIIMKAISSFIGSLEEGGITNLFSNFSGVFGSNFSTTLTTLLMLVIMTVAMFISFRVSVFIYSRKEF